jgi:hypothetical protein
MHPAEGSLDDPSSGLPVREALRAVLAASTEMHAVAVEVCLPRGDRIVVSFVQTQTMGSTARRWSKLLRLGEHRSEHLVIVAIGPGHDDGKRHAGGVGLQMHFRSNSAAVGWIAPDAFSTQRGLGHAAIHAHKRPIQSHHLFVAPYLRAPQPFEYFRAHPSLEPEMGRRARAQPGNVQRAPLASRSPNKENRRESRLGSEGLRPPPHGWRLRRRGNHGRTIAHIFELTPNRSLAFTRSFTHVTAQMYSPFSLRD